MNYTILLKYEIMAVLYNHKQNVEKLPKWRKHLNYRYSKITVISRIYSNGHCGHINVTVNQANYWPKWPKLDPKDRSIIGMTVIDAQNWQNDCCGFLEWSFHQWYERIWSVNWLKWLLSSQNRHQKANSERNKYSGRKRPIFKHNSTLFDDHSAARI